MFLFHAMHFLTFLVKSQPQRSYKKGSYIKKSVFFAISSRVLISPDRSDFFMAVRKLNCEAYEP